MIRILLTLVAAAVLWAGDACPAFSSSIGFAKGDPRLSMSGLRGKAVLILFGQSWCPICNGWTPEMLPQIEKAWADHPGVVLLLVKTDGDAASGREYLTAHGGDAARWFVAGDADAAWTKQVMGKDELWQYAIIDPSGAIAERGKAGMFMGGEKAKRFVLATSDALRKSAAAAQRLLPADLALPEALQRAARLAEAGCFPEAIAASATAQPADQKTFKAAVLAGAGTRVTQLAAQLAGEGPGRMPAYLALRDLATALKGSEAAKAAADALRGVAKDPVITRELAAEKAWNGALAKIQAMPVSKRDAALVQARGDFAKAYADTWFAGTIGVAR